VSSLYPYIGLGSKFSQLMSWAGDQTVDWTASDGLPSSVIAALSLAVSGMGLSHSDIGTEIYTHGINTVLKEKEEYRSIRHANDLLQLHGSARPYALQRHNAENSKQIFPEKEFSGLSPYFHIHISVRDLYIPTTGLPILLQEKM
jgi:hypothetical protein